MAAASPNLKSTKPTGRDLVVEHLGGVARAALGQHEQCVEYLERPDDAGGEHEQQGRVEERKANAEELAELAGAVELRGLVELHRYGVQTGQEKEHVVTDVLPDIDEGDHRHNPQRRGQVLRALYADMAEHGVHEPEAGVQYPVPNNRHGHRSGQVRGHEHGPKKLTPLPPAVQHYGQAYSQGSLQRDVQQDVVSRHPERVGGVVDGENLEVILEPGPSGGGQLVPIQKADEEHQHHGDEKEEDDAQQTGRDEGQRHEEGPKTGTADLGLALLG